MSDKKNTNYTALLSVIIALLVIIIGEVYYFSTKDVENSESTKVEESLEGNKTIEKNEIVMITDKRCGDKCNLTPIVSQLRQVPSLVSADIKELDYSDE
jgi:hypothetical protein